MIALSWLCAVTVPCTTTRTRRHGVDDAAQFLRQDLAARARHAPCREVQQARPARAGHWLRPAAGRGPDWARRTAPRQGRSWRSCSTCSMLAVMPIWMLSRVRPTSGSVSRTSVFTNFSSRYQLPLHARRTGGDGVPEHS